MQNSLWNNKTKWHWALGLWLMQLVVLLVAGLIVELFLTVPRPAYAQGTLQTTTHTTVADWQGCVITNTNMSIANANGGELRLAATVEDYFDGTAVDATRWYSDISNISAGGSPYVTVSGGVLTLDGMYLLSTATLTQLPRFFEARARMMQSPSTSGRPDVGFWRHPTQGPLYNPDVTVGGSRLFVVGDFVGIGDDRNDLLIAARNGSDYSGNPVIVDIESDPDLTQFIPWRIEWESAQTRFYANGVLTYTSLLASNVYTSWAFLYHQSISSATPTSTVTIVDWVRAGQYPSSGEFVSCAINGYLSDWNTLSWTSTLESNTSLALYVRSSSDGVSWGTWAGPFTTSPVSITSQFDNRYLQYRVVMTSTNPMFSPEIQSISITRIQGPTAVTVSDFQVRAEGGLDWRWVGLAVGMGILALGVFGSRARHP